LTVGGVKKPDTPASWPFGTAPEAPAAPAAPPAAPELEKDLDALTYLQRIYRDPTQEEKLRFQAAIQAVPYEVAKPGVTGKKAAKDEAAKKAHSRFAPSAPPKLAAVGGSRV
jgi:phage terminase small subunit